VADLRELQIALERVGSVRAQLVSQLKRLAALSYNMYSADFLNRARRDVERLSAATDSLLADLQRLIDLGRANGVTIEPANVAPPEHDHKATLGTTIGDQPALPGIPQGTSDTDLATQLTDEIFSSFNPGLKVGTGEAASDNWKDLIEGKSDEDIQKATDGFNKTANDLLVTVFLIDLLTAALIRFKAALRAYTAAIDRLNNVKVPNPESTDGTFKPKFPLGDPWSDRLRRPKGTKPLDDPSRGDIEFGPSDIFVTRGQATDPSPADDKNDLVSKRTIKTTSDAVTDPLPGLIKQTPRP